MRFTPEHVSELNLLAQFEAGDPTVGIKVHSSAASPDSVAAAARLHEKGLTTQVDGGYLTSRGRDAAESAHTLLGLLCLPEP